MLFLDRKYIIFFFLKYNTNMYIAVEGYKIYFFNV